MDLGVLNAGFDIPSCIGKDRNCCETLRENIKREGRGTIVYEGDIRELSPDGIMQDLRIAPGSVDLLFGIPPCQAFSQIGKLKSLLDERGELLFQMARHAKTIMPLAIMIEQVKGLLTAKETAVVKI